MLNATKKHAIIWTLKWRTKHLSFQTIFSRLQQQSCSMASTGYSNKTSPTLQMWVTLKSKKRDLHLFHFSGFNQLGGIKFHIVIFDIPEAQTGGLERCQQQRQVSLQQGCVDFVQGVERWNNGQKQMTSFGSLVIHPGHIRVKHVEYEGCTFSDVRRSVTQEAADWFTYYICIPSKYSPPLCIHSSSHLHQESQAFW